jgi:hypothetical protein
MGFSTLVVRLASATKAGASGKEEGHEPAEARHDPLMTREMLAMGRIRDPAGNKSDAYADQQQRQDDAGRRMFGKGFDWTS